MSKTGAWVLDMQETAADLLTGNDVAHAREEFMKKFPGQGHVFDEYEKEFNGEDMPDPV